MKKYTILALSVLMILSLTMTAFASESDPTSQKEYSITVSYNQDITNEIVKNPTSSMNSNSVRDITINLTHDADNFFVAVGEIELDSQRHSYAVGGDLVRVSTSHGDGFIGFMSGEFEDGTNLGMNLHYIPATGEVFVYASVGYVTEDEDCKTYIFGDMFDEMNTLVEAYSKAMNITLSKENDNNEFLENNVSPLALADYNTTYRGIGIGQGSLVTGKKIDLVATTIYTPKKMVANEVYKGYVKVNGHKGNAQIYIQSTKGVPGAIAVWTTGGSCTITAKDNNMELSNMDPGNDSWSVVIPIPYYVGGSWGFSPWSINIGVSTIKTTLSKNPGSYINNIAQWKHNYTEDVDWDSKGAAAAKKGYAGCCSMIYTHNQSSNISVPITASGSVDYSYSSTLGVTSYTGNFTAKSSVTITDTITSKKV